MTADGQHLVQVTGAKLNEDRTVPTVDLTYATTTGDELTDTLVLSEKGLWRLVAVLRALGIKVEKSTMQIPFSDVVGRKLLITVADGRVHDYGAVA